MFFKHLRSNIKAARANDPAATSWFMVLLTYPGIHVLLNHQVAHFFYRIHLKLLARLISNWGRFWTGIEIHPGAKVGYSVFIDHGMGTVIGETSIIGNHVTLYQGVTLGGVSHERIKRHPTLEEGVTVSANATVLGDITIGKNAVVGAGAVVTKDVPPNTTVVGIPAKPIGTPSKLEDDIKLLKEQVQELQNLLKKKG